MCSTTSQSTHSAGSSTKSGSTPFLERLLGTSNSNIILAVVGNILSWMVTKFIPSKLPWLLPFIPEEEKGNKGDDHEQCDNSNSRGRRTARTRCVAIGRPGGMEQLKIITLKDGYVTCGYNLQQQLQQAHLLYRPGCDNNNSDNNYNSRGPFVNVPTLIDNMYNNNSNNNNVEMQKSSSLSVPTIEQPLSSGGGEEEETTAVTLTTPVVVVRVRAFSINYADCCIRWGLYESANRFVGYPICPGFDVAGIVEEVIMPMSMSTTTTIPRFQKGDRVYGCSFFGAYSTRVVVPMNQLRLIPGGLSFAKAAAIPAVSLTALYALHLGGRFPFTTTTTTKITTSEKKGQQQPHNITVIAPSNKSILIHSAAGGVGSMLVQMSKILGLSPIVGVVGRTAKVDEAKALGCDVVIDKQRAQSQPQSLPNDNSNNNMWKLIEESGPQDGYSIIMDPNGISTLKNSYDHLCPTGRLIIFGFHSNLPMGQDSSGLLNPIEWMKMIYKSSQMPQFDPMDLVSSNKSVLGFNLSFFVDEINMLMPMYDQIEFWLTSFKKEEEETNKDKDVFDKEEDNDDDDDDANDSKESNHEKKPKQQLLRCPRVTELPMDDIVEAHKLIQSGKTVGKLVMITDCDDDDETTMLK